jgi:hypothetical protein
MLTEVTCSGYTLSSFAGDSIWISAGIQLRHVHQTMPEAKVSTVPHLAGWQLLHNGLIIVLFRLSHMTTLDAKALSRIWGTNRMMEGCEFSKAQSRAQPWQFILPALIPVTTFLDVGCRHVHHIGVWKSDTLFLVVVVPVLGINPQGSNLNVGLDVGHCRPPWMSIENRPN